MKEALKDTSPINFTPPEDFTTGKPILDGQETAEIKIKIDTMSNKLATQYTPESTIKELSIKEIHNILYYINKDDPQGKTQKNPEEDPQFKNWENSVIKWAEEQGFDSNSNDIKIPTEYDDIHKEEDQPNLIIITPLPDQTIEGNSISIEITASAKRGIKEIEYYIDDKYITTKNNSNDTVLDISNITSGNHTLIIKAKDDLQNTTIKSVNLNLKTSLTAPNITWISPSNNSSVTTPFTITANISDYNLINKIDFYCNQNNSDKYIGHIKPSGAQISLVVNEKLNSSPCSLYGNIFDTSGNKYKSSNLNISISE